MSNKDLESVKCQLCPADKPRIPRPLFSDHVARLHSGYEPFNCKGCTGPNAFRCATLKAAVAHERVCRSGFTHVREEIREKLHQVHIATSLAAEHHGEDFALSLVPQLEPLLRFDDRVEPEENKTASTDLVEEAGKRGEDEALVGGVPDQESELVRQMGTVGKENLMDGAFEDETLVEANKEGETGTRAKEAKTTPVTDRALDPDPRAFFVQTEPVKLMADKSVQVGASGISVEVEERLGAGIRKMERQVREAKQREEMWRVKLEEVRSLLASFPGSLEREEAGNRSPSKQPRL